jgi:hypothetical protein
MGAVPWGAVPCAAGGLTADGSSTSLARVQPQSAAAISNDTVVQCDRLIGAKLLDDVYAVNPGG